jgi:hypothetical protein
VRTLALVGPAYYALAVRAGAPAAAIG